MECSQRIESNKAYVFGYKPGVRHLKNHSTAGFPILSSPETTTRNASDASGVPVNASSCSIGRISTASQPLATQDCPGTRLENRESNSLTTRLRSPLEYFTAITETRQFTNWKTRSLGSPASAISSMYDP